MAEHEEQSHHHGMTDLIEAHLAYLRAAGKSPHTIADRGQVLRRVDRELPYGLEAAATEELVAWLGQDGWAKWTRRTYWMHLHSFFRWATTGRHAILDWDPSEDLSRPYVPPGVPRPVTDEELTLILARAVRPWRTALLCAAYAGMRASELAAATRTQLEEDPIRILGKGDKTRTVPRHDLIRDELPELPWGPILARPNGGHYNGNVVSRSISAYLTSIGFPDVAAHRLRHWYATTLLDNGVNIRVVQELMGHASLETTMIYTRVSDRQREIGIRTLPVLNANHHQEVA
jgi:integrase